MPANLPALPSGMTNEEQIRGLEDAVIHLRNILERTTLTQGT